MRRLQISASAALTLAALLLAAGASPALADCVAPLAACTTQCTREFRPEHPDRRLCARQCISAYQRCERIAERNAPVAPRGGAAAQQ